MKSDASADKTTYLQPLIGHLIMFSIKKRHRPARMFTFSSELAKDRGLKGLISDSKEKTCLEYTEKVLLAVVIPARRKPPNSKKVEKRGTKQHRGHPRRLF